MSASARDNGIRLLVRVQPGSSKNAVEGWQYDSGGRPMLKLRVAAAPVDGAANTSLVALLAKAFGVRKSAVTILRGATSRIKQVYIEGDRANLGTRLKTMGGPA